MADQLRLSWHDSAWIPHLNLANILDYFCQKSNPFYDKLCNNEIAKMQKLNPEQMQMMVGMEYVLLYAQEPILYVIRKQERVSQDFVTALVDYYILAGVVYQAPDLNSIIQSRVANCTLNLKTALEDFQALSSFSPSAGYSWKSQQPTKTNSKASEITQRPNEFSRFQMKIGALMKNFSESIQQ